MAANAGKTSSFACLRTFFQALGILRRTENVPKVWKELDVDAKRFVNIKEYRDRTEGILKSWA